MGETLLFKIKATETDMEDEQMVRLFMDRLMHKWPQIKSYQFERAEDCIHILMWGDIEK